MHTAQVAVNVFHSQFNQGEYHKIYDNSDGNLRNTTSETKFVKLLEAVRSQLGEVTSSTETAITANGYQATGIEVKISQKTEFTQGEATEHFIWLVKDNTVKLRSYDIATPDLMLR